MTAEGYLAWPMGRVASMLAADDFMAINTQRSEPGAFCRHQSQPAVIVQPLQLADDTRVRPHRRGVTEHSQQVPERSSPCAREGLDLPAHMTNLLSVGVGAPRPGDGSWPGHGYEDASGMASPVSGANEIPHPMSDNWL